MESGSIEVMSTGSIERSRGTRDAAGRNAGPRGQAECQPAGDGHCVNDVGSVCQIHVYQAARRRVDVLRKLTADVPATVLCRPWVIRVGVNRRRAGHTVRM